MRLALSILLVGCSWQQPVGAPTGLAPNAPDGTYEGEVELELRAFAGPVRVKREVCTTTFVVEVDTLDGVRGTGTCVLDGDDIDLVLLGEIRGMPFVGGDLESDNFEGGWEGWFYDDDRLYGETVGETMTDSVRIEWFGWFDVGHQDTADHAAWPGEGGGAIGAD